MVHEATENDHENLTMQPMPTAPIRRHPASLRQRPILVANTQNSHSNQASYPEFKHQGTHSLPSHAPPHHQHQHHQHEHPPFFAPPPPQASHVISRALGGMITMHPSKRTCLSPPFTGRPTTSTSQSETFLPVLRPCFRPPYLKDWIGIILQDFSHASISVPWKHEGMAGRVVPRRWLPRTYRQAEMGNGDLGGFGV